LLSSPFQGQVGICDGRAQFSLQGPQGFGAVTAGWTAAVAADTGCIVGAGIGAGAAADARPPVEASPMTRIILWSGPKSMAMLRAWAPITSFAA
jgi:hypothetical protein